MQTYREWEKTYDLLEKKIGKDANQYYEAANTMDLYESGGETPHMLMLNDIFLKLNDHVKLYDMLPDKNSDYARNIRDVNHKGEYIITSLNKLIKDKKYNDGIQKLEEFFAFCREKNTINACIFQSALRDKLRSLLLNFSEEDYILYHFIKFSLLGKLCRDAIYIVEEINDIPFLYDIKLI
jgi:hypothetical protein